jgi:hypothetical protein
MVKYIIPDPVGAICSFGPFFFLIVETEEVVEGLEKTEIDESAVSGLDDASDIRMDSEDGCRVTVDEVCVVSVVDGRVKSDALIFLFFFPHYNFFFEHSLSFSILSLSSFSFSFSLILYLYLPLFFPSPLSSYFFDFLISKQNHKVWN